MGIEDPNQRKRHNANAFSEFVDKQFGTQSSRADSELHGQKRVKLNSEAPLSTLDQPFPSITIPKQLLHESIQFQLFVSRSYSPPSASSSAPPVYILKVTSASNSNGDVEAARNGVEGGATTVVTETRLVAEGQFLLRSRL